MKYTRISIVSNLDRQCGQAPKVVFALTGPPPFSNRVGGHVGTNTTKEERPFPTRVLLADLPFALLNVLQQRQIHILIVCIRGKSSRQNIHSCFQCSSNIVK